MYGSLTEADTYFVNELTDTWDNYTDAQKTRALEDATRTIDRLQFKGQKYEPSPTQTAQFPRVMVTVNHTIYFEENISAGEIQVPVDVEIATYVQAKYLLDKYIGGDDTGAAVLAGKTSVSIASTSETYDTSINPVDIKTGLVREAMQWLEQYILVAW